ncbi:MAG: hypothetical protein JWN34_2785, partial [Bryobacterales bacterium]|nr:hypothetical protein [Bryobacterales bacterium]
MLRNAEVLVEVLERADGGHDAAVKKCSAIQSPAPRTRFMIRASTGSSFRVVSTGQRCLLRWAVEFPDP